MFAFKAILDASSSRKRANTQRKKKKVLQMESEGNINRNLNSVDNPIEIEDDEESDDDCSVDHLLFQKKLIDEDMKKTIEIHSSGSVKIEKDDEEIPDDFFVSDIKNPIQIHSSGSSKIKKDHEEIFDSVLYNIHSQGGNFDEGENDFSSDSDYEEASIKGFKKFIVKSDRKVIKKKAGKSGNVKSLYARVSLNSLYGAVNSMNQIQKDCVRRIGFGSLLDMKTQSIPTKLCYFVVDSFDHEEMVIKSDVGNIAVTREEVNKVLGLPLGVEQISCLGVRGNEDWFEMWKEQFKKPLSLVVPSDLVVKIVERSEADMLLYVDRIKCKEMSIVRRYPVINFWTSEQLKFRESKELANGGFGNGVDAEKGDEELESGYILDIQSDIQWAVSDLSKKVEMALQKHANHQIFHFYRGKLEQLVFDISKFQQSDFKNDSRSDSLSRKITFEDKSFTYKEMGKGFYRKNNGRLYGENDERDNFMNEDVPSFDLGIESEMCTPKKGCLSSGIEIQDKSKSSVVFESPVNLIGNKVDVPSYLSKRVESQPDKKSRPKRNQMLPQVRRSPFVIRAVDIESNLTREENIISNWVFSLCQDPM
ncbi:unnamed protein product [Lactuca saligna]|uniref:Uncharacterized protein n=1 Tax=Lactuca saligna TaxID=75948 RepID=A0AA35ZD25_LACSI|nr:unnamed protein product [Lactuca saligna]